MKTGKLRWGFVGCGHICHRFITGIFHSNNSEVSAVYGRRPERANAFADQYEIPHRFYDIEEMIHSGTIDVAYIGVTHAFHVAFAKKFLEAGIPVLCEKPLAPNAKMARELVQCAREHNTFLMEAMWSRFFPAIRDVQEWIAQGKIGRVESINSTFGFRMNDIPITSRAIAPEHAGGVLLDLGVYQISMMNMLLGHKPIRINASAWMGKAGTDETTVAIAEYPDNVIGTMACAYNALMDNRMTIYGDAGSIQLEKFYSPIRAELFCGQEKITKYYNHPAEGFQYEIDYVADCIAKNRKEPEIMPLDESIEVIEIMDGIRAKWGLRYPFE